MSEGRISARKCASNTIVSKGPDVCWTPRGSCMAPVPYSSIAFLDTAVRVSTSVRNNGKYDFQLNSRCATSTGHEPGVGKGVKSTGYLGPAHAEKAADHFFSEGYAVVAHNDPAWINRADLGGDESQKPLKALYFNDDVRTLLFDERPVAAQTGFSSQTRDPDRSIFDPKTVGATAKFVRGKRRNRAGTANSAYDANGRAKFALNATAKPVKSKKKQKDRAGYAKFDRLAPDIMKRLIDEFQLTPEQAAGFVGNLAHESVRFTRVQEVMSSKVYPDYNQYSNFRGGIGFAQWTNSRKKFYVSDEDGNKILTSKEAGGRRDEFEAFSVKNGLDPLSDEASIQFFVQKLKGRQFNQVVVHAREATDVKDATKIVMDEYENPNPKWSHLSSREGLASRALQLYNAAPTSAASSKP